MMSVVNTDRPFGVNTNIQPAKVYEGSWCAVTPKGEDSAYWDACKLNEDRRQHVVAADRGWCNPIPHLVAGCHNEVGILYRFGIKSRQIKGA